MIENDFEKPFIVHFKKKSSPNQLLIEKKNYNYKIL